MIRRTVLFLIFLSLVFAHVVTAQEGQTAPRHVTLEEAVQLALKHNHVIRMAGFKVEEAGNGEEGLAMAQSVMPNIIILDVMMPSGAFSVEVSGRGPVTGQTVRYPSGPWGMTVAFIT